MAKPIKMTTELVEECMHLFSESLTKMRLTDGKITFSKTVPGTDRKAKVIFSEMAWLKMNALVREYDTEIGWHGIARRGDGDVYHVDDIIVYPQVVAAATVTPDQVEYQNWLMGQPDEIFNNIRFQGHSHVNMGVTPSTVDTAFYEEILSQLDDTMFYIFMVVNKKGDRTVLIYDLQKNLFFGNGDVSVNIRDDGIGVEALLADAAAKVTKAIPVPALSPVYSYDANGGWKKSWNTPASAALPKSETPSAAAPKKKKAFGGSVVATRLDDEDDNYYEQLKMTYGLE